LDFVEAEAVAEFVGGACESFQLFLFVGVEQIELRGCAAERIERDAEQAKFRAAVPVIREERFRGGVDRAIEIGRLGESFAARYRAEIGAANCDADGAHVQSGIAQARNATPEFHQGAAGYGRYYWHTYADYVGENLWVEFILPAALHQDSRYYTLGRGGFAKRFAYSVSRVAITRNDSGRSAFNASEILGAGAASGISSLYYPSQERTFSKTFGLWMTNLAIDGGSSLFKEFWPDINNKFFHQKN